MKKKKNLLFIITIFIIIVISFLLINEITNTSKGTLTEINYKEITKKIDNKDSFALIISRSNCSHCIEYKPKVKKIANKYNINIYYIDYDKETNKNQTALLDMYNLDGSTPITIFIKKGKQTKVFDRIEGDVSEERVIKKLKELKYIK